MFWLWPSLKDACQRPGYICGKFLEIFILENVLNMPLYLNDSLAGYSILETKILFFFSFKLSDNFFLSLSGPGLAPSSLLSIRAHFRWAERVLSHDALEEFYKTEKSMGNMYTLLLYYSICKAQNTNSIYSFFCVNKYEMAKLLNFKCNNIHFLECKFCMKWPNLWFRNVLVQAHIYSGHILVELDQVNCLILLFFNFISFWIPSFLSYSIFPMP